MSGLAAKFQNFQDYFPFYPDWFSIRDIPLEAQNEKKFNF